MILEGREEKMYSNVSEYQKANVICKKSTMPPILTISILILIISFVMIARGLIQTSYDKVSIPTQSSDSIINDDKELNTSEREVLTMLSSVIKLPDQVNQGNTINSIYNAALHKYLRSSDVYLTSTQARQVKDKIIDMQGIISFEGKSDFSLISLEGRKVIIYISEQIYELCGLKLVLNMEGIIEQISDLSGNIIYTNLAASTVPESFQMNALVLTLLFIATLFGICTIIAKKNQLFIKEVAYDGFEEERFA